MSRVLRVAVAGCGTVGGALLDLLARHGPEIARRSGTSIEVTRVLVRDAHRPRSVAVDRALVTDDMHEFIGQGPIVQAWHMPQPQRRARQQPDCQWPH